MFFEITEGSEHGELAFRNIISCWKWYAYVKSQKNDEMIMGEETQGLDVNDWRKEAR